MKLSIIIITKNEEKNIGRLLDSLEKIKNNLHEVIIVDAGSTDRTVDIAKKYDFTKVCVFPDATRGAGRNYGIQKATGDIIAFLNADTEITGEWIIELLTSFELGFDIVAGYSPDPQGKHLPRVSIYVNGQDITYPTCNIAYRKEVFDEVGMFNERLITAEDIDLNYRAIKHGYTIFYNPKMKALHYHRRTLIGFLKQAFWNGYGRMQLNKLHPELKYKHEHGFKLKNMVRLIFGAIGYAYCGWKMLPIIARFAIVSMVILLLIFVPILRGIL